MVILTSRLSGYQPWYLLFLQLYMSNYNYQSGYNKLSRVTSTMSMKQALINKQNTGNILTIIRQNNILIFA